MSQYTNIAALMHVGGCVGWGEFFLIQSLQ